MTKEQIVIETTEIVAKVLKHSEFVLEDKVTANQIKGWDSLSHMVIITEIEKHFHVKFDFMEIINIDNMGDLFSILESKLA
jgi:acyl carrier protein